MKGARTGTGYGRGSAAWLAGLAGALLAMGCSRQSQPEAELPQARSLSELTAGEQLAGQDSRAWLSFTGSLGDANYCSSNLRLPLDPEPAWSWEYSAGGFSPNRISGITHFNGRLYLTAYSDVLACLDSASGAEIYRSYLRPPLPPDAANDRRRRQSAGGLGFSGQCLHPAGNIMLLTTSDGYRVSYDVSGAEPAFLWQGRPDDRGSGFLMSAEGPCVGLGEYMVHWSLDGTERWSQLTQSSAVGNVLSAEGILLSRTQGSSMFANRLSDGALLWSLTDSSQITGLVVDDYQHCVYVSFRDERIDALALADGSLLWSHDFSGLPAPAQRELMVERANTALGLNRENGYPEAVMDNLSLCVSPDGLSVAVDWGYLFALDHRGQRRWLRDDLPPIASSLVFGNAIMVQEYWYPVGLAQVGIASALSALPVGEMPDWPEFRANLPRIEECRLRLKEVSALEDKLQAAAYRELVKEQNEAEPLRLVYTALELLDPSTGASIGHQPLPAWVQCNFCPAGDKIVFDASGSIYGWYMQNKPQGERQVQAYNWLVPEGKQ